MKVRKGLALSILWADTPVERRSELIAKCSDLPAEATRFSEGVLSVARYIAVTGAPFFIEIYEINQETSANLAACTHLQHMTRQALLLAGVLDDQISVTVYRQIFPGELDERNALHRPAPALQIGRVAVSLEHEEEFNEQYNTEHLVGYLRIPGVYSARRYVNTTAEPRHLAIYELANDQISRQPEWDRVRTQSIWRRRIERFLKDAPGSPGIYRRIAVS